MRTDRINLVDGFLWRGETTVGPRHDPYARETVELYRGGVGVWRLVSCALAGDWLEIGEKRVAELPVLFALTAENRREYDVYAAKVALLTGMHPRFWLDKVWGLRDSHKSPEWHAMRDIDERLLSYAM